MIVDGNNFGDCFVSGFVGDINHLLGGAKDAKLIIKVEVNRGRAYKTFVKRIDDNVFFFYFADDYISGEDCHMSPNYNIL